MKELEKTKRITIAAVLFILVVLVGILSFKKPKNNYAYSTADSLEKIIAENQFISIDSLSNPDFVLIDVRNNYEYGKGSIENSINIPTANILQDNSINLFKNLRTTNKTAVLVGNNPQEANIPYMLLYQIGYSNLKVAQINLSYNQTELVKTAVEIEKLEADIPSFISESVKKAKLLAKPKIIIQPKPVEKPKPKKVELIEKVKRAPAEGGC